MPAQAPSMVPSDDVVIVVYSVAFENHVEQGKPSHPVAVASRGRSLAASARAQRACMRQHAHVHTCTCHMHTLAQPSSLMASPLALRLCVCEPSGALAKRVCTACAVRSHLLLRHPSTLACALSCSWIAMLNASRRGVRRVIS